jgi:hypothetical protein
MRIDHGRTNPAVCVKAGGLYAVMVFVPGFGLGAIRVLLAAPHLGATLAVLLETPIMLALSWNLAPWCVKRLQVPAGPGAATLMGASALAALMLAEFGVAIFVFNQSTAAHFAGFASAPGLIGLAAQLGFACIPLVQASRGANIA